MKPLMKIVFIFIGIIDSAHSFLTTGSYIRELSTSTEVTTDNSEMATFNQYLHLFALNQSSGYLVKSLADRGYSLHESESELNNKNQGMEIWQKLRVSGVSPIFLHLFFHSLTQRRAIEQL